MERYPSRKTIAEAFPDLTSEQVTTIREIMERKRPIACKGCDKTGDDLPVYCSYFYDGKHRGSMRVP